MPTEPLTGTAYSYIRFSSKEQERGDSVRRQRALRDAWLAKHPGVTLETLKLEDLGVSAFRGRHRSDKHALGQFLDAVKQGRVPRGAILIIENLDRLTRQDELEATHLFTGILLAGVTVVQLEPETVFTRKADQLDIMRAVLELGRGHGESARKSARVGQAWRNLQALAAADKTIVTSRCPAWLEVKDGKFRFKPGARDVLKRIFRACVEGRGARIIARDLDAAGVPHFAGGVWQNTYVTAILGNRAVCGEYQAHRRVDGKRVKTGPPVVDYFPAAITPREWLAAQKAIASRKRAGGVRGAGGWVALFPRVYDARTGERMQAIRRVAAGSGRRYHVLQPSGVLRWATKCVAFPLDTFEAAVLGRLAELDPADVLPPAEDGTRVAELADRLAEIESRIGRFQAAMVAGSEDEVSLPILRGLDDQRKELAGELAAAQQDAASPAHEQLGTLKALVAAATDPDARLRIRGVLTRLIDRIDILVIAGPNRRLAAVQVRFAGRDVVRGYLVQHQNARRGKRGKLVPSSWTVRSFAGAGVALDLRKREDAAALEQVLAAAEFGGEEPPDGKRGGKPR